MLGRGGSNAKQIRQDHGVLLRVTQDRNPLGERLCLLKGTPTSCAQALEAIAKLLVENADQINKKVTPIHAVTPGQTTMTVLFHESVAGAVIGKHGSIAKQVFNQFKGKFKVTDQCLEDSTDKALHVTGEPEVIGQAYALVLQQLFDIAPKWTSPPRNYLENSTRDDSDRPRDSGRRAPPPPAFPDRRDNERWAPPSREPYWEDRGRVVPPPPAPLDLPFLRGFTKIEKIIIPNVTAPMVIGPGGAVIRSIEERSGCTIVLSEQSRTAPDDRMVNITGAPDAIERAIVLIRDIVERPLRPPPSRSYSSYQEPSYSHYR